MSLALHEVAETLVPRRYQEEIFSRAQERNVIAALDTGSGKTYISTLLIKWIVTRDAGQGKICVFLVPKVALVDQQGDFIAKETGLRVSKRYGSTAIDMTDRRGWRSEIEDNDVLVMTAQIFLNILTHSHWTIDKVSLIVFDECHHTRKNHAYNGIMREYFQESPEKRPKVFGMTASPIWNPRDAVESLATLERNLDAKVIAVREHVAELADHSPRPREIIVEYEPSPPLYPGYPSTGLWDRLGLSDLPPHIDIPLDRLKTRYDVTYHSLGPYGAELFLYHEIKFRLAQFTNQEMEMEQMHTLSDEAPPNEVQLPEELQDMATVLAHCSSFFEDEENPDIVPTRIDPKWCSPKVIRLSQLLFEHYNETFQGIVFVEQRHVAMCLSKMLPRIPPLELYFKSAQLIGHGANSVQRSNTRGMALRSQRDVVEMFRNREINLLVATSVAEEGLDFPACELVIRFDPIQHMVGYIQSRGRARQKTAAFVVMVQQGQASHVERYKAFSESEPQLRLVYQTRDEGNIPAPEEELEEGEEREDLFEHPDDLAERERYVVPSTGAILTYNTSIGLLNHLCSLIPRDRYTPVHLPQYSGDFESNLMLPPTLPLPTRDLTFVGPTRRTKKEAKRAVAFMAVKRLHALGVFDDYLLPSRPSSGDNEDADGRLIADVSKIPETMEVVVRDPWTRGERLWLHYISLDGRVTAGLITGSVLPSAELVDDGIYVSSSSGVLVEFDDYDEWRQRRALDDFMRMGLWWCITGRGISLPLTSYLVPITPDLDVDWEVIYNAVAHPYGVADWSTIREDHCNRLLVTSSRELGRPLILTCIRNDLTPMSTPTPGSRESVAVTYHEFYTHKYTRKTLVPDIPTEGPCIEARLFPRRSSTTYALDGSNNMKQPNGSDAPVIYTFPQKLCRWAPLSPDIYQTFHVLPALMHRLTDLYRARAARAELGLPPIADDLLVQALTLPNANAGFNNQRLETLGDSVLKLCTVVHLYNRFPHRHEGQLDVLRRNSVSNRTLLSRAKEIQLEQYLTSEPQTMRVWRYTLPADTDLSDPRPRRWVSRRIPKRSLQDCMEATLGASYVTGGLSMSLQAGNALGLGFGGTLPWRVRYGGMLPNTPSSPLFLELQEIIGYQFKCGKLLAEAVTHPSFRSPDCSSYQRLEFLGDALIDLVVITYLHNKFPHANSGQLSWARSRAVCSPALAWVAVNKLNLHRILLINNVELSMTMKKYVDIFNTTSDREIVADGWKHDPPKALSDVLESVLGAAFVDMDYDFEKASVIVENVLQDLLEVLSPDMPRDPVSELMVWSAKAGCRKISFRKSQSRLDIKRNDSISVIVHDFAVVGPITAANMSLAKGLAAERARQVLEDEDGPHFLHRICDCDGQQLIPPTQFHEHEETILSEPKKLDDETEDGFAALARQVLTSLQPDILRTDDTTQDNSFDDDEEETDFKLLPRQFAMDDMAVDTIPNGTDNMLVDVMTNGSNGLYGFNGHHKHDGQNGHVAVFTMDVGSDSEDHQPSRLLSAMDLRA